jgi:hypothetical protein
VIILVYHLYFSDLKQNSYDFSKFVIFSDISNNSKILFIPNPNLPAETDWWGRGPVSCHTGTDQVKVDWEWCSPPVITEVGDSEAPRMIFLHCSNEDHTSNQVVVAL